MGLVLIRNIYDCLKKKTSIFDGLKLTFLEIWESLVAGGRNMMGIGVAVASAGIIVGIVTLGLGGVVTDVIDIVSQGNLLLMLFITAGISLLLGMGLPTTATTIL